MLITQHAATPTVPLTAHVTMVTEETGIVNVLTSTNVWRVSACVTPMLPVRIHREVTSVTASKATEEMASIVPVQLSDLISEKKKASKYHYKFDE